jgi:hypothetical protein
VNVNGISPKVAKPALATVVCGVALVVVGLVLKDNTVLTMGLTALGIAPGAARIGYGADVGDIAATAGAPVRSDDLLGPEATEKIEAGS